MSTTVSATIIFLNGERFLAEAIESVLAQSYPHWELLLVDDGSTDGSSAIARDYAARFPEKLRYLAHAGHRNLGMSASRNLGVANSRGDYLAFLDADDVWEPNKLADQVALLEARPEVAMLYGRTLWWFSWTGKAEDLARDRVSSLAFEPGSVVPPPDLLARSLLDDEDLPCTCSVLIRRAALERVGGFEADFRDQFEDMIFYAKLWLEFPVYVADGCWDRYRQHPRNSSALAIESGIYHPSQPSPARGRYLAWIAQYLEKKGLAEGKIAALVAAQRWPYLHPVLHKLSILFARIRVALGVRTRLQALVSLARGPARTAGDRP